MQKDSFSVPRIPIPITVLRQDDSAKPISYDDVWIKEYHRSKVFPFAEAVECHREIHHPTIYNLPTSTLFAFVHLDMEVILFLINRTIFFPP